MAGWLLVAPQRRLGSETPRIFTPPLRPLTPETSWGFAVIEFATAVLFIDLLPWQKWLLIHALEVREDGSLRFKYVVVLVARQNGKSTVSKVLALWWIFVCGVRLVLGTAQDLDTAEEVWGDAVEMAEENDELAEMVKRVVRVNGKKSLDLVTGERYKVKAANRKAGRGMSGDRVILDELREHENWDAWGAITKTTRARPDSQIWCFSNAGDVRSVVLRYLRKVAHRALGDPDGICREDEFAGPTQYDVDGFEGEDLDDVELEDLNVTENDLGIFEWSTNPARDKWDRNGWPESNPSLGYLISERTMASECRTDPDAVFRTEALCQWLDGAADGVFPPGSWEKTTNDVIEGPDGSQTVSPANRIVGRVAACLDQSHDRSQTWVAFAGFRADGVAQGEVVAGRHGTDWVADWLMDPKRRPRIRAVTGQGRGAPVSSLIARLKERYEDPADAFDIPVEEWSGGDLLGACGEAFDAVRDGTVRHNPQPVLDQAAATAVTKPLGDGWVINRVKSPSDAAPLMAWIGALWLLGRPEKTPPPASPPPRALAVAQTRTPTDDLATAGF